MQVAHVKLDIVKFSIVITGTAHNPTILNPDFLARWEIVPEEWGWKLGASTLTTPAFSQVQYESGVVITVEPGKLQIQDAGDERDPASSRIGHIAKAYVSQLPHVPLAAIGLNFNCLLPYDEPKKYLRERFLRDGPWDSEAHSVQAFGLRLRYELDDGRLTLALDSGTANPQEDGERMAVVTANGNLHRQLDSDTSNSQLPRIIGGVRNDWESFRTFLLEILE